MRPGIVRLGAAVVGALAAVTVAFPMAARVAGAADVTPPSRPVGVHGDATSGGLRVVWSPAADDVAVRGYLVHRDGSFLAWVPGTTSFNDLAVAVGTTYRYEIRAQDTSGNNSVPSAVLVATFDPNADRVAPSAPTGVRVTSTVASAALDWDPALDNRGVRGYLVHRDGQFRAWVPSGTSWTDTNVTPGTTYRYEIRGQDAAGNNSAPSDAAVVTVTGPVGDPPLTGLPGLVVTSWGNDATGDGSASRPYRTITAAARAVPAGGAVYVSNGVYRESIDLVGKSISLRAVPGATPVMSGADPVTTWTPSGGRWWTQGPDLGSGPWPVGFTQSPLSTLGEIVVFDGNQLRQVTSVDQVGPTTFWVDSSKRIWIGRDPAGRQVEVARRTRGVIARSVDRFEVDGLTFRHYASGPGDLGALEIWGNNSVVRNVTLHDNANAGLRLTGWRPLVERVRAIRNGRVGAVLHHTDDAIVWASTFNDNNTEGFHPFGAAGGIKTTASRNVRISGNEVLGNLGHGIWFDLSAVGIVIDANHASRNTEAGILVEVSAQALVNGNVTNENGRGIYIVESNDVRVLGNTAGFNERNILVLDSYREGNGCVDREAGAIHVPPIDDRFGCQWPLVRWDIQNLLVEGNIIVGGRPGATQFAMFEVNHVAHPAGDVAGEDRRRSAEQMGVVVRANYFERRQAGVPRWVVGWSQYPVGMAAYERLDAFLSSTGQGAGSSYVGP